MNSSKRHFKNNILLLFIIFIEIFIFFSRSEAQNPVQKDWDVMIKRRYKPFEQEKFFFSSYELLKLDSNHAVWTLIGEIPETDVAYILTEACKKKEGTFVNDAIILLKNESVEKFVNNNSEFIILETEASTYTFCIKVGMKFESSGELVGVNGIPTRIYKSNHRTSAYLNRFANFFGLYKKDLTRAAEFLNKSFEIENEEIKKYIYSDNIKYLKITVEFFDDSNPLELVYRDDRLISLNKKVLKEYLETVIYAREKLITFYPEHRDKLNKEKNLLKKITSK
jgi:hypothetical protein